MGAATMAFTLWDRFLKHNPTNPDWPDRDRFILSPGHASMAGDPLPPGVRRGR
jgi:transketolase